MVTAGTKFFFEISEFDRITLSEGTSLTTEINGQPCSSAVLIPKGRWRIPSRLESKNLALAWNEPSSFQQISVIKLPDTLIRVLKKANLAGCRRKEEVMALEETAYWNETCLPLIDSFIDKLRRKEDELQRHKLHVGVPKLDMVTTGRNGEYTGLHLDSWEKAEKLSERSLSRNRICINLGNSPRYFLVLNLNLQQVFNISDTTKTLDFESLKRNEYTYSWEFLHDNPDYPITRVKVNPYEAYIAPTENMLHDGSTEGMKGLDIHLTYRSFFEYKLSILQKLHLIF